MQKEYGKLSMIELIILVKYPFLLQKNKPNY